GNIAFTITDNMTLDPTLPTVSLITADTRSIGWSDAIALNSNGTQTALHILQTQPNGSAGALVNISTSNTYSRILPTNLTNDLPPDLLPLSSTSVGVWFNVADDFNRPHFLSATSTTAGTVDFNQDDLADLIVGDGVNLTIYQSSSVAGPMTLALRSIL